MDDASLEPLINSLPEGYSVVTYRDARYGMSVEYFNQGASVKVYAEELGGSDHISLNFYYLNDGFRLKTCEMPREKVVEFLRHHRPVDA